MRSEGGGERGDGVTFIVAGIAHDAATHAVWAIGADGGLGTPGLLDLDTGDGGPSLVFRSAEGDDKTGEGDDTGGITLTVATVMIDFTKEREGSSSEGDQGRPEAVIQLDAAQIASAIGALEPVTIDLSDQLPSIDDAPTGVALLGPARLDPVSPNAPASPSALVLAELTPEQAAAPTHLVLTKEGMEVRWISLDGISHTLATHAYASGQYHVIEDDIMIMASFSVSFSGSDGKSGPRARKIARRVPLEGSGEFETTYAIVLESLDAQGRTLEAGDYNGDGLDDISTTSGVYFGDGLGGLLPSTFEVTGGPTVSWPPTSERAAGNGKGTRKASAQPQQANIALL